jgi:ankyrin repeat protein
MKLLHDGVDVDENYTSVTPLFLAALGGNVSIVEALINAGAQLNREGYRENFVLCSPQFPHFSGSPLAAASHAGHLNIVDLLLSNGATDVFNSSMNAAAEGHVDVLSTLIQHVPEVNRETCIYRSFKLALRHNCHDVISYLLPINTCWDEHILSAAAQGGSTAVARLSIEDGKISRTGLTYSLDLAAKYGHEAIVTLLLEHLPGYTFLWDSIKTAFCSGHPQIAYKLLDVCSKEPARASIHEMLCWASIGGDVNAVQKQAHHLLK